jgi:hypothetical protein
VNGVGCHLGTAERRQRSDARGAAGSRNALVVPRKSGKTARVDPMEGSEASDGGIVFEKYVRGIELWIAYQRNKDG